MGKLLIIILLLVVSCSSYKGEDALIKRADSLQKTVDSLSTVVELGGAVGSQKSGTENNLKEKENDWKSVRNRFNNEQNITIDWKVEVSGVLYKNDNLFGSYEGIGGCGVQITGLNAWSYKASSDMDNSPLPVVHGGDWISIKGKVIGIEDDGYIIIEPISVKNLGVR